MNSALDIQIVSEEMSADPDFRAKIQNIMKTDPDWEHTISDSANKAVVNEISPGKYPESAGSWPKLRSRVRAFIQEVPKAINDSVNRMTFSEKMAVVRKVASSPPEAKSKPLAGLGQLDIIGSLVGAASSIYSAVVTSSAQHNIAQMQANAAMQTADAQMAMANAQAAINAANANISASGPVQQVVSTLTTSTIAGIPAWAFVIPILYWAFGRR